MNMITFFLELIKSFLQVFGAKQVDVKRPEEVSMKNNDKKNIEEKIEIENGVDPVKELQFKVDDSWMIPTGIPGHAVSSSGWTYTNGVPTSITWHWTATWDRKTCDKLLGGSDALRKPQWNENSKKWEGGASAHYCVGRSFQEGISQYVSLEHRSWHAGGGQKLRWDGKKVSVDGQFLSGARTSVGIETVEVGFERAGIPREEDWVRVYDTSGKREMWIQPWTEEQIEMMIYIGKEIIKKYPHIQEIDHHGHMDICPGHKDDPSLAFPFAKVLSGIYERDITDVWSPFLLIEPRQKALQLLGYDLGSWGIDGNWGNISDAALRQFQKDYDLEIDGYWSTFVCRKIEAALKEKGLSINDVHMKA